MLAKEAMDQSRKLTVVMQLNSTYWLESWMEKHEARGKF